MRENSGFFPLRERKDARKLNKFGANSKGSKDHILLGKKLVYETGLTLFLLKQKLFSTPNNLEILPIKLTA